jgi:hypothetical protein
VFVMNGIFQDSATRARRGARLLQAIVLFLLPITLACSSDAATSSSYAIDRNDSLVRIYVYRAGLVSFLGHDHVVSTNVINGGLSYSPPPALDAEFKLTLPVDALAVDDPEQRKSVGGRFSEPVTAEARAGTRRNMLSEKVLDAAQYPYIKITGHWLDGSPSHGTVAATIGVRDTLRNYKVPVDIQMQDGRLVVTGMLHILQTELGIAPLSILGGALKVADGVDVRFTLAFTPVEAVEQPRP